MKIRHILPPDGLRAVYATLQHPYAKDVPCIERALVTEQGRDTTIGRVVMGDQIVPAHRPIDGSVFVAYVHPGRYTEAEYRELLHYCSTLGYQYALAAYEQGNTLAIENIDEQTFEEDANASIEEADPDPRGSDPLGDA